MDPQVPPAKWYSETVPCRVPGRFRMERTPARIAAYTMASPVQPLRLRCPLTRHRFPKNLLHVVRNIGVESHVRLPLVTPSFPFPIPNHLCMPTLGYTRVPRPQMAVANRVQAIGNPPPTCTPPRSQALLPPASRRNESPTSGNPVRWVVGKGLPGVIIPNVDLVTRSGAGSRPYHNGTWNEGAARRPQGTGHRLRTQS